MKTPMKMMKLKVIDIEIKLDIRSGKYTILSTFTNEHWNF